MDPIANFTVQWQNGSTIDQIWMDVEGSVNGASILSSARIWYKCSACPEYTPLR